MSNNVAFGTAAERSTAGQTRLEQASPAASQQLEGDADADAALQPSRPSAPQLEPLEAAAVQAHAKLHSREPAAAPDAKLTAAAPSSRTEAAGPTGRPSQRQSTDAAPSASADQPVTQQDQQHEGEAASTAAAAAQLALPSREDKLASARERYLSRKRKGPDA